ncbi:MAG: hypothetical protein ND895_15670 [Pyrinomonadaceae bacterium]|nr:hypothetical protein [Pyrinomonadaceae bacterium]
MRPKALSGRVPRPKKSRRPAAHRTRIGLVLSAILVALAIGTIALSRTSTQAQKKSYVATREIILDKASGKLRKPTAQETDEMVAQLKSLTNRSTEDLTQVQHDNGMVSMDLKGRFGGVVLGRANADGTTEVRCVFTMEEAEEFLGLVASSQDQ